MRIVHLCSMDFGGAGKAAYRLHKGLQEIGVDSSMVVMCKKTSDDSVYALPSEVSNYPEKWWSLLTTVWGSSLVNYPLRSPDNELFSAVCTVVSLEPLQEIIRSADIINVHWVAGMFDSTIMPQLLRGKKVVWTLHDMNPFTGGCHYAGECIRYRDCCGVCPQLASDNPEDLSFSGWTLKQQSYRDLDITVVTPSRWLGICSENSTLLGRFSHKNIPYGFPIGTFKPLDRQSIRSELSIPPDARVVLFCADSTATKRKGFSYLLEALKLLLNTGRGKNLTMAIVGNYNSKDQVDFDYPMLSFGHIGDEDQLALLYNAADVFVLPSLEDNLPNTVVEALACGTPVAAFDVGGVPDMVEHGITGYLAPAKNVAGLADAIEWCVNYAPAEIRHSCRAKAEGAFALEAQANQYKKLYDTLSSKKESPKTGVLTKKTAPKISIVTPSYNQAEYLEECIDSILSQNYPNLEYIIMDGGSTDGSVEIIRKYEKHLTYWQSQPDGGQYQAINAGFKHSTGDIMCWLNSDDKFHPGALHQVALAFRAMPQTEWITGRPTAWDDQGRLITVFDHVPTWSLERLLNRRKDDYYIQQESTFWRRSLWDKAGGVLDTNWQLAADFELWCRFFHYSELTGVDALFGGFRYHSGQKTNIMMDRYEQEVLQIIDRERLSIGKQSVESRPPAVLDMGNIISAVVPNLTPDAFSCFSYSRGPHFNWFEVSAKKLFGSAVHPDYCDLKMYQDLLCYTFIVDNLPKGSRLLEVGGCDSRVLKALKNDYECWNVDKLEGLGNGLTEVVVDGYRMVRAYLGDFSEELPDGYFDFVFSISALEHVAENEENFNNICSDMDRVMKPGAFSLHCFDVVVKYEETWTNQFLHHIFRRYKTINTFIPFEQMRLDPSVYYMSEHAYNCGWRNITKVSYKEFGRPLSYNILWQKTDDQSVSVWPSLQGMVPDLKSLIAWYYDQNKVGFTASEKALLYSGIEDPLNFLKEIKGPLFADTHTGRLVKQIMLSRHGKAIRDALPKFRPYCLKYFPQMMINILSDGAVTTCCFDAYGGNQFGSIYEKQLSDIWRHDLPRVMQGDLYDYKRCLQCIGVQGWAPVANEEGKREEWLEWMSKTPNEIQIEITSHCNYACVFCASASIRQQRSAFLDLDRTFENIRGILKKTHKLNLYNYGEPLLHHGLSDFIHKCRAESSELILELATNGMLLNEEISRALIENRVDRIIVSVHGGPGTENMLKYSSYGADYDKVLNNVGGLLQLRKDLNSQVPKVSLRAILFHWNDNDEDMNRFREDAKTLGLSATWGHYDTDNYHWILDSGSQLASKKYISGSAGLKALVASREFFSCGLYEEECKRNGNTGGGGQDEEHARIVVATSIAPKNIEQQKSAITSWLYHGFEVISVNTEPEIAILKSDFLDVTFVETKCDARETMGRPLIFLDDVFVALKSSPATVCGIINSDIHLCTDIPLYDFVAAEAKGAFICGHRYDVENLSAAPGKLYLNGYDIFFFDRSVLDLLPPSPFCLGATWWDIWVPLAMILKKVPAKRIIAPLAFHVLHKNRWDEKEWLLNSNRLMKLIADNKFDLSECSDFVSSIKRFYDLEMSQGLYKFCRDFIIAHTQLVAPKQMLPDGINPDLQAHSYLVSAIVSTYNAENFFRDCISNLIGQSLYEEGQLEIIIINSGSGQNEEGIAQYYMEIHDHIVYQRTERETLYAAWNRGVKLARGKYITHANTDDRHSPHAFKIMAHTLERYEVGLVYVDALMTTKENENFSFHSAGKAWLLPDFNIRQALLDCPFGCQVMWRRSVHEQVGMFDASYKRAGDYEFFLRAALKAGAIHLPETLTLYHESPNNLSYQAPDEVIQEVNRFIGTYRRQLPLEIIYPYLQHDSSPLARAAALVDFANNLMGTSGFLFTDTQLAEAFYHQALGILPRDADILGNLAVAFIVNGKKAEARSLIQSASNPCARLTYYKDMLAEEKLPELSLTHLAYPGLETMQAVKPAHEIRVPWERPVIDPSVKTIIIDGVIFQLQHRRPFGISRVWLSLLSELGRGSLASRIILLDRVGTAPKIPGIQTRRVPVFRVGETRNDSRMLDAICREENAELFLSTYCTYTTATPSLLMLYDMIPECFDTVGPEAPNPEWRDKYHAIVNSTAFAAISDSTARDLVRYYPQVAQRLLTVIPCAVSEDFREHSAEEIATFKASNCIDRPYFLLVGRRDRHKNAALFFRAFSQLPGREQYAIVMAGGGNTLESELRELAGPAAGYTGFFSDQDLSLAYSGAIALVYPSIYEGFGLPILEAMQSGCPVITCQNSSLPEVAGSAALYVGENNVDEMLQALQAVQQPEVREYLVKRGQQRAAQFSWQDSAGRLVQLIDEVERTNV